MQNREQMGALELEARERAQECVRIAEELIESMTRWEFQDAGGREPTWATKGKLSRNLIDRVRESLDNNEERAPQFASWQFASMIDGFKFWHQTSPELHEDPLVREVMSFVDRLEEALDLLKISLAKKSLMREL